MAVFRGSGSRPSATHDLIVSTRAPSGGKHRDVQQRGIATTGRFGLGSVLFIEVAHRPGPGGRRACAFATCPAAAFCRLSKSASRPCR